MEDENITVRATRNKVSVSITIDLTFPGRTIWNKARRVYLEEKIKEAVKEVRSTFLLLKFVREEHNQDGPE